jgi:hypothetical protein
MWFNILVGWEPLMISKQSKRILLIVSIAASLLSGCWSLNPIIHPTRLLDAGTKVEIIDVTKDVLFNSAVASDQKTIDTMIKRIIVLTCDELAALDIDAYTEPTLGAAKLKFEIRTVNTAHIITGSLFGVNSGDKFEIRYRAIFENSEGKRIFIDTDKEDGNDIDELFETIARRTARNVANSFKNK